MSLLSLLLPAVLPGLYAQSPATLWSEAAQRLKADPSDTATYFLPDFVRERCRADPSCRIDTYTYFQDSLEQRFHLPGAVLMAEQLLREGQAREDQLIQGRAHLDLYRFYDALDFAELAADNLDRALPLLRNADDPYLYHKAELFDLRRRASLLPLATRLDRLRAIQERAGATGDERSLGSAVREQLNLGIDADSAALVRTTLPVLRNLIDAYDYGTAEHVYEADLLYGRRYLATRAADTAAVRALHHALIALYRTNESEWRLVNSYNELAAFELDEGRPAVAERALDQGIRIATANRIDDLLVTAYELYRRIAEQRGALSTAYRYLQLRLDSETRLAARSAGFSVENYFLRTEKEKQDLELELQRQQLRTYQYAVGAGIVLLLLLGTGLYFQRRSKHALARQNQLISRQADALRAQDAAKTRFFANVGHELRTPLTLILGPISSLAAQTGLGVRQRKLLGLASRSGRQLRDLIDQILDFSRLEAGALRVNPQPTDLRTFFKQLLQPFQELADQKNIHYSYRIEIAGEEPIDRTLHRRIGSNLLSNGFKFTPAGGSVSATVALHANRLRFVVRDTGPGIAVADQSRIFERYYQSEPGKHAASGSGIGLSLVHEYVALLGGEVTVESTPGEGSTFTVLFPTTLLASTPQAAPIPTPNADDRPALLLVEDQAAMREYVQLLLQDDYRLYQAEDGERALELLAEHPEIALVISDVMMPGLDGFGLLARLRAEAATRGLPVMLLTALTQEKHRLRALRLGVDDYLAKPFEEAALRTTVERLLQGRADRRAVARESVAPPPLGAADQKWLETFETYVRDHYRHRDFSVGGLSKIFAMSESTLLRRLKRLTGLSPSRYLHELRLAEGRELLRSGRHATVAKVAYAVGYTDVRAFSKAYQKRYGVTPSTHLLS